MAQPACDFIREKFHGRSIFHAPMRKLTTIRVGGPVDVLIHPSNRDELAHLTRFLTEHEVSFLALGNGSNLVVSDGGIRGAAVSLKAGFNTIERSPCPDGRPGVRVEGGLALQRFVRWTAEQGIGGFEALSGIPGTVGGALVMNAGAWGFEIGERVAELETLDPRGQVRMFRRDELRFDYRSLQLPSDYTVLAALLVGEEGDPAELRARAEELGRRRRETQPTEEPSAGSVFKNPPGQSAGRLIDECGFKGVRVGGATVSTLHANFIVNAGNATAADVVGLMTMIQEQVYEKHGFELEPEVRIVGDWETSKDRVQA